MAAASSSIKDLIQVHQPNPLQSSPLKISAHQYPLLRNLLKKLLDMKLCFRAHPSLLLQRPQQQNL